MPCKALLLWEKHKSLYLCHMWSNLEQYQIILASQSPRRVELLQGLDIPFEQKVLQGIDESHPSSLASDEVPEFVVRKKAKAYASLLEDNKLIIVADTLVLLDDEVLGKPNNEDEAKTMLRSLSGRSHKVTTAVGILTCHKAVYFSDTTTVSFAELDEQAIDYYIKHYAPYDKAGGYGVQEWIGYFSIEKIEGSYFNVMGLPVQKLAKYLLEF